MKAKRVRVENNSVAGHLSDHNLIHLEMCIDHELPKRRQAPMQVLEEWSTDAASCISRAVMDSNSTVDMRERLVQCRQLFEVLQRRAQSQLDKCSIAQLERARDGVRRDARKWVVRLKWELKKQIQKNRFRDQVIEGLEKGKELVIDSIEDEVDRGKWPPIISQKVVGKMGVHRFLPRPGSSLGFRR